MADGTVKVEFTVDDQKMIASIAKQNAAHEKTTETLKKQKKASDDAGQSVSKMVGAFDKITGAGVSQLLTGIGAATAAIGVLKKGLDMLQERENKAGEKTRSMESVRASLTAAAAGDPRKQELFVAAGHSFIATGGGDKNEAAREVEKLNKTGELKNIKYYAQMRGVAGAEGLEEGMQQYKAAYGDADTKTVFSKAMAVNPAKMAEMIKGTASVGRIAGLKGIPQDQIMASLAATEDSMGGVDSAALGASGALEKLTKSGRFQGMDLNQIMSAAGNMSNRQLMQKSLMGTQGGEWFATLLKNRGAYSEALGREGQTNNGELFDKTFANRTPLENVARQTRIAGQLRESFDEQNMGGTNVAADEYINEMTENAAKGTGGNAAAAVRKAVNVGARYFMGDENYIGMKKWAGAGNNEAPNATKIQSEYEQQMLSNAKQQTEHLDNMASGSKTINHATE